jgi:integral membrane protein (TIGR00529 family)
MLMTWAGFLISLAGILLISRKNLALGLACGAIILGVFTLPLGVVLDRIIFTLTDPPVLLLALAMGIIPLLGGTMKQSGQIDALVNNIRLSQRYLLPFSAALMGLLPMPGGALLSAPILERGGQGVADPLKAVINNWFRHLFILIYPLNPALIVSAKICKLDVYQTLIYLFPGFILALVLGYIFYLRKIHGQRVYSAKFSWAGLLAPLGVILAAPLLDFGLKRLFSLGAAATVIGVSTGLLLSIVLSPKKLDLRAIAGRMKPWNFALIIIGMFLYLHIFQVSEARGLIASLPLPPLVLAVSAGFLLGFVTGRVQLPTSIVFPVYMATVDQVQLPVFALIYIAVYFGYIISPVHPCLVVTCEYFRVPLGGMIRKLAWPVLILFITVLLVAVYLAN